MKKKLNLLKILTAISAATFFDACTQAPAPCVAPESAVPENVEQQPAAQTSAPAAQQTSAQSAVQTAAGPAVESATQTFVPVSSTEEILAQPQQTTQQVPAQSSTAPAATTAQRAVQPAEQPSQQPAAQAQQPAQTEPSATVPDQQQAEQSESKPLTLVPVDPYTAVPNIISDILNYADTMFKQGNIDGAVAYLQRFRILKPLWNEWASRTDSLLNVFGMTNAERAKQFEPLILEIKNMNRVNAAYTLVAEAADSLIALAPGDSLINFAKQQKEIAYKNTIGKALKEKTDILSLAEAKARFEEALKQANEFKMRYRDFENELQIEKMIAYIQGLQNSISEEDKKYWEKNDPEKALAEVDTLIEKKSYAKAKTLVEKLKASKLRQQAAEKYQKLADAVCTDKRKAASLLYSQATKQKKPEKKKELLLKAIGDLNACSDDYPEYEKIKTVMDNIIFLKKELDR